MSRKQRDSKNKPDYYYGLTSQQQARWDKNTKKIEKNEQLRSKYPPFQLPTNINVIHIHHGTSISTINELIKKAEQTKMYVLDTESAKGQSMNHGALMQIQFISSNDHSTIALVETYHLPQRETPLFIQIQKLLGTIFNTDNAIISWGLFSEEIKNFIHLELFNPGRVNKRINLQFCFRRWHNGDHTHPLWESRECGTEGGIGEVHYRFDDDDYDDNYDDVYDDDYEETRIKKKKKKMIQDNCKCGHHTHNDPNSTWSLQDAMESVFKLFIDKTETVNNWQCGLDLQLNTWKVSSWENRTWNANIEKQIRAQMEEYAIKDCFSVEKLFFKMYPMEPITTSTTNIPAPIPIKQNYYDNLSDISEDELIQMLKPKFDKKEAPVEPPSDHPHVLEIATSEEEINLFNTQEQQQKQEQQPSESTKLSKSERQRRKNEKLKWKQQNRPDFQNNIKRPIYYRYNYHKVRSQLMDDDIHTSHQIKIDERHHDVIIGFKSSEEKHRATKIMRINYFSRDQYYRRWGR
jgi:hypothetical protein